MMEIYRNWTKESLPFPRFSYDAEGRASNYLFSFEREWPDDYLSVGPTILSKVSTFLKVAFDTVSFQAYQHGSAWCDWHPDAAEEQAVLSIGSERRFEIRDRSSGEVEYFTLGCGDLIYQPRGFQELYEHRIPIDDSVTEERCALVFRTGSPWG